MCPQSDLLFEKILFFALRKRLHLSALRKERGTLVHGKCNDRIIQFRLERKRTFFVLLILLMIKQRLQLHEGVKSLFLILKNERLGLRCSQGSVPQ